MTQATLQERILVVEPDPAVCDLICQQALKQAGFLVESASTASIAIRQAVSRPLDLIITNLNLPDLSGKDLIVALASQGVKVPVIVLADQGMESEVIQAFRLGAADYLSRPIREAEVVAAVERALTSVRARKEREVMSQQLQETNQKLNQRVQELTTILSLGKAVTSISHQPTLFKTIVDGAASLCKADRGWLLVYSETRMKYLLRAYRNIPGVISSRLNQPLDDGVSSMVALSGETLMIHGDPIKRFKIASLGQTALVVPVKAQKQVMGLLVMVRKNDRPFSKNSIKLIEAVADYASISMLNSRLFQVLEERANKLQRALDDVQAVDNPVPEG